MRCPAALVIFEPSSKRKFTGSECYAD